MELLSNPKTEYLLDASLEYLHSESLEWLKEIDFWKDEMSFFYKLLHKGGVTESLPSMELAGIEQELVSITADKLDKASNEVRGHERSLAALMKTTSTQEETNYRHVHRQLLHELIEIHVLIRDFKRSVFAFVQKYQPSNCINLYEQNYRF